MKSYVIILGLLAVVAVVFFACGKDAVIPTLEEEKVKIKTYLTDKKLTAKSLSSGVCYVEEKTGTGTSMPTLASTVTVNYKGYLLDGTVFDQTPADGSKPIAFPLSNLIRGWQEGIPTMKKGGKTKLFIPSSLGYGATASGKIPANSILVFEIELVDFK
jgi:FKBP-type peptidyl-prolyl cis-trans isomerase FkpA